jgi:hypothetical protein
MGSLGAVVSFERATTAGEQTPEVRIDRGGDEPLTAGHYTPPGVDAAPLPGDNAYAGDDVGAGVAQVTGYQDPLTPPLSAAGEVRVYSRALPGVAAAEVWAKADGTLILRNPLGSVELAPTGKVTITTPLGAFGADSHAHLSPFGPTGGPIPGT